MSGKTEGKVVLVTGASSGMGKDAAIAFAKEGAKVVLAARSEEKLLAVSRDIEALGGEAAIAVTDASKEEDCKKMVDMALDKFGGLHVAFNNHGVFMPTPITEATDELATTTFDINLKSLVFCFKYQIPAMAKTGDKGSIIVNSSALTQRVTAKEGFNTGGIYAASKAGADMLMKYAAIEGAPSGVRVNSVAPGHVATPIYGDMPSDTLVAVAKGNQLIGRPAQPEEVTKLVMFLASEDAAMITGAVMVVDGGFGLKA